MDIFKAFESNYEDILQVDGAFSTAHINYGRSPVFNGVDGKNIAIKSRDNSISSMNRIENVLEQLLLFDGTEKDFKIEDRILLWEKYWLEYINAFDKTINDLPKSIVTAYIGRQAIEIGFKYLLVKKTNQFSKSHDLGELADILFSEYHIQDSYMEYVDVFCRKYCMFIEGGYPDYFRFPEYEDNTFFAGNCLDISWLSYNMSLIILKLIHFAGLDNRFNKKAIRIEFEDEYNEDCFIKKIIETKVDYYYTDEHTIKDLYIFLLKELGFNEMITQDGLELRFHIKEEEKCKFFRLDYNLEQFIKERAIDGILKLSYTMGIPGGMGACIFELANIRINPDEQKHKYIPHVHISPYMKQAPVIRIELNNLTQMKGDDERFEDVFNKKQRSDILTFLQTNQRELIEYFNRIQKGEYIPHFPLYYKGKMYDFN